MLVFETGKDIGKEGRGPDSVIVSKYDDVSGAILDAMAHLKAFVGKRYGEDANAFRIDLVGKVLKGSQHFFLSDDEDFLWLAGEPAVSGFFEFLASIDGGDDDGHVFSGDVGGIFWYRNGTVCPPRGHTY